MAERSFIHGPQDLGAALAPGEGRDLLAAVTRYWKHKHGDHHHHD